MAQPPSVSKSLESKHQGHMGPHFSSNITNISIIFPFQLTTFESMIVIQLMIFWLFSYKIKHILFSEAILGRWVNNASPTTEQKTLRSSTLLEEIELLARESSKIGMIGMKQKLRLENHMQTLQHLLYIYIHLPSFTSCWVPAKKQNMQQKTAGPSFFPVTLQLITQMEVT